MSGTHTTFSVRDHVVDVEKLERNRWRVRIDGHPLATFCSESRARSAGRNEARRLALVADSDRHR